MRELFTDITYYKLQIRKYFVYYVIDLGGQGYRVGGVGEILDQVLIISRVSGGWSSMGKKPKIVAGVNLRKAPRCTMTNAVEGNFLNTGWNVVKTSINEGVVGINGICSHVRH